MRPFVKWAGGKAQLLNDIKSLMPKEFNNYYEPFVGGGALFFDVAPKIAVINDSNEELIFAYECFASNEEFSKMIERLNFYTKGHSELMYYAVREMDRKEKFLTLPNYERAARLIYLNKSCFNGLYRVNGDGFFNVPFGKKEKINCYNKENFDQIHSYFSESNIKILNCDFEDAVKNAKKGDFVYFDPPYDTWDDKDTFTSYAKNPFGKKEQVRLADCFKRLSEKGVYVMLSNHNTHFIQDLYNGFNLHIVEARRNINSNGKGRGKVEEVIITNYE